MDKPINPFVVLERVKASPGPTVAFYRAEAIELCELAILGTMPDDDEDDEDTVALPRETVPKPQPR